MVDNVLERSLYLSCPEAARIILLRSSEIRFNIPGEGRHDKYTDFPTVDTSDELFGGKPYKHFGLIRNFIMHLLRNRRYKVWERMVILGMYCDQVSRIPEAELLDGTPVLTESFTEHLLHKRFDQTLSGVVPNSSLPLNVVINTIEDRIKSDYTSPRFVECYRQSLEGLGYCAGTDLQTLCENFMTYQRDYYEPYFASREYIWENYLVSKVYKDLFPFGAQKAVYHNPRTIYQEYILLAAQYIFARTLMVGLIAYGKSNFSSTDVVRLIQSLSRATEHDASFMSKLLRSLEQAKITELATFATMVKI
jgi:lysine-N-methylase